MSVVPDDIISHTHFTTHEARFFIHIDNVEPLSVYSFEIDEGISTLFQIRVQVVSRNDQLDLEQILSQHTSLEIFPIEFGGSRFFNGIVSRVEQGKSIGRFTFYTLTIVPQLYTLTLGKDFRIYQNETVENIIKDVFSRNSIPSDTY
ncbi:MAG: phage late control D family protein, partial [Gammaproteobacteria bacterium]|nr:phage late control D family protein [Gammaproteobacteria bacterium]